MKIRTLLTILAEVHEDVPDTFDGIIDVEERYFADINRALLQAQALQSTQLLRSQIFLQDSSVEGVALRACPFCGKIYPVHVENCTMDPCEFAECEYCSEGLAYRVICDPDRGGCGVSTIWSDDIDDAADDWNRRAERV